MYASRCHDGRFMIRYAAAPSELTDLLSQSFSTKAAIQLQFGSETWSVYVQDFHPMPFRPNIVTGDVPHEAEAYLKPSATQEGS